MALSITIDNVEIDDWSVNPVSQNVSVHYRLMASGEEWKRGYAIFWVTLPDDPVDGRDFQLPSTYTATLIGLTNDAASALETYWNI